MLGMEMRTTIWAVPNEMLLRCLEGELREREEMKTKKKSRMILTAKMNPRKILIILKELIILIYYLPMPGLLHQKLTLLLNI